MPPLPAALAAAQATTRLRDAAGARFDSIEVACEVYFADVVDGAAESDRRLSERYRRPAEDARLVPNALVGSLDTLVDTLEARRERWSMSYWILPPTVMESMAPLIERLAGC